ncbi:hypothetical protein GCM10028783_36970 [Modestobacter muralis]
MQEAVRNVAATPLSSLLRVTIAAAAAIGCVAFTVHDVDGISTRFDEQVAAGRYVWREAGVTETARIPAARCDALQAVDGVQAAGSVLERATTGAANQPLATYDVLRVTPGYVSAVWPQAQVLTDGVVVGSLAAANLGLVPEAALTFTRPSRTWVPDTAAVSMVMDPSPRDTAADRQILIVSPPVGTTTECVIAADPGAANDIGTLLSSWFPADTESVTTPWLRNNQLGISPDEELQDRRSQFGWPAGFLLLFLTTAYLWYGRRSDDALYALLGIRRGALFLMHLCEVVLLGVLPASIAGVLTLTALVPDASAAALRLAPLDLLSLQISTLVIPVAFLLWTRKKGLLDALKGF